MQREWQKKIVITEKKKKKSSAWENITRAREITKITNTFYTLCKYVKLYGNILFTGDYQKKKKINAKIKWARKRTVFKS